MVAVIATVLFIGFVFWPEDIGTMLAKVRKGYDKEINK